MILAAARALAQRSPAREDPTAPLLPRITDLRPMALEIAMAVGLEAQRTGHAPRTTAGELRERLLATQWTPTYPIYQ
jgi:malate dehydrogenase (oxaloacetate-decarboxylating)